ncbi:MAG: DUF423 domain-containing protein [Candidatus Sericytochromatia bacterium]|nr:DUF423 domain-containing protein [Candidatus Sericytochromatia bacterium]
MGVFSFYGALAMALAVGMGAFGAHALKGVLSPESLTIWETANRYHVYHAFALFLVDLGRLWLQQAGKVPPAALSTAGWLFLAGLVLFSGSLYTLAFTGIRWLGAITPLGGVSWIIGWLCLAYAFRSSQG